MRYACLVVAYMLATALCIIPASAQEEYEDQVFVENYKKFRSFVDPLASYNLYLVPDGPSSKMLINDLHPEMKEAYHFLRRKNVVKNKADFNVAVIVKSFAPGSPYSRLESENIVYGGVIKKYYAVRPYYLSLSFLVYAKGMMIEFPLCVNKEFLHEEPFTVNEAKPQPETIVTKKVNGVNVVVNATPPPKLVSTDFNYMYQYALSKISLSKYDFKNALAQTLHEYKNYYVDRVD